MFRHFIVMVSLLVPALASAQTNAQESPLIGVWSITSVVTTGADAVNIAKAQPSMVIFTRGGHYSYVAVQSPAPRPAFAPAKNPDKLTDAEKIARFEQWSPFAANGGTYQVSGTTLTRRPTVAKNVTVMTTDPPNVSQFKVDGKTLTLVNKSAAGQPASETRTTLTRVE
jgi:hypothetical protein